MFLIVTGVAKDCWDASLGNFLPFARPRRLTLLVLSFGLLHRIPPPPDDREPGMTPPELYEGSEDFEEQQLFVPAEVPQPVPVSEDDHYQEWNQTFHPVSSGHTHYDEHGDPLKPSFYGNGHHGHTVHILDHDHDHDHQDRDHGHDYEHEEYDYESSESSSPQVTAMPFRLPSNAPTSHSNSNIHLGFGIPRSMTPTQTRPLSGLRNSSGAYTNGDSRP